MAESCYKWCDRGQGIRVVGRLKQSRWEENNVKKSRIYVVAEHVEYKFSKPKDKTEKAPEVVVAEAAADKAEAAPTPAPAQEEAVF